MIFGHFWSLARSATFLIGKSLMFFSYRLNVWQKKALERFILFLISTFVYPTCFRKMELDLEHLEA